jgi:aldose 1-epimerase
VSVVGSGRAGEASVPAGTRAPSGEQFRLVHGDQEVVVTEVGATVRSYTVGGVPAIRGFGESECSTHARGQMLLPWPGRIGDGHYRWDGVDRQLPIDEVELGNAIHGLARWGNWMADARSSADRLVMRHRLHARDGYPFCLDLAASFELGVRGLRVVLSATNVGAGRAPFGAGAHPYLTAGPPLIDACLLRVPAATMLRTDARMLPLGRVAVDGTEFDFREPRPIGPTELNTAYTDLERDAGGTARLSLESPEGRRLVFWAGGAFRWVMLFSGDALLPAERRSGLAIEPMTCPPDAFRSGEDLIVLAPGDSTSADWGIEVAAFRG